MEESGVPGENHWPVTSHWQTLPQQKVHTTKVKRKRTKDRQWSTKNLLRNYKMEQHEPQKQTGFNSGSLGG